MKAEILAPAGNRESLNAAWAAGADAVYFGLQRFGARAFAKNFTLEEAREIIAQAHLGGKKVYVTMNTLLEEDEVLQAADTAEQLYRMGVDALIIQDLGLLHLLHHTLPDLELHASTQISVNRPEQIERLRKLGVKRVVLAREATIEEIEACAKTGMELEVFVHGALCISYSGQCRFSQVRFGRSGNKGACAQPCRMEYTLYKDGEAVDTPAGTFLLSPRDLSLLEKIPALEKAGGASLKIEGRMKSPEYVFAAVTAAKAAREGGRISRKQREEMMTAFNRGYTLGHTFGKTGLDLMNSASSNHQGVEIGTVKYSKDGVVYISLKEDLHQNDGLRIVTRGGSEGGMVNFLYNEKGKLTDFMPAGSVAGVRFAGRAYPGNPVRRTSSYEQAKEVERAEHALHLQSPVTFHLFCQGPGQPLFLTISDGEQSVTIESEKPAQAAQKQPATLESVRRQLEKTGNTWAHVTKVSADLHGDLFIPVSSLNELRRQAIDALAALKTAPKMDPRLQYAWKPESIRTLPDYIEILRPWQNAAQSVDVVSEFPIAGTKRRADLRHTDGEVTAHLGDGKIVEDLNITNSYALAALLEMGYEGGVLCAELSDEGRKKMLEAFEKRYGAKAPAVMTVYEKPRLMIMKHCPVNTALKDGKRENCSLCRAHRFELEGKDGKRAALYGNPNCLMQIFDEKAMDLLDDMDQLAAQGVTAFRMVLTDENKEQSQELTKRFESRLEKLHEPKN